MQVQDETMIRLRVSGWPIDQQPCLFQLTVGVAQSVRQLDALPRQTRATGRAGGRFPRGLNPVGGRDSTCQFAQGPGRRRVFHELAAPELVLHHRRPCPCLQQRTGHLHPGFQVQLPQSGTKVITVTIDLVAGTGAVTTPSATIACNNASAICGLA